MLVARSGTRPDKRLQQSKALVTALAKGQKCFAPALQARPAPNTFAGEANVRLSGHLLALRSRLLLFWVSS